MISAEPALAVARKAWGLGGAGILPVTTRENRIYRVDRTDGPALALRLHRPGYRTDAELCSEISWLRWLSRHETAGTDAVPARDGNLLVTGGGYRMTAVTWNAGRPLADAMADFGPAERIATFHGIGRSMARLHQASDAWVPPDGFTRPRWDIAGLVGDTPLWGRFSDNPGLDAEARATILASRNAARRVLSDAGGQLDHGLVHADLVRDNILLTAVGPAFIDFDDGGWGFRVFDVATTLYPNRAEPDFAALQDALLAGYRTVRPLDTALLPLFLLLRAFTYLGWIIPRMDEPGAPARNARFVASATSLARDWLACEASGKAGRDPT